MTAVRFPATGGFSAATLDPVALFTGAVAAAVGFSVTAYPGTETPMAYGGELRATSRQITNATYLAVAIAGVANVLAALTVTSALGPQTVADRGLERGSEPVFAFLTDPLGAGGEGLFGMANLVAVFGAALILHHAASRSLAAAGVLPTVMAKRDERSGAPVNAAQAMPGAQPAPQAWSVPPTPAGRGADGGGAPLPGVQPGSGPQAGVGAQGARIPAQRAPVQDESAPRGWPPQR
ncbi:hypothetical protein [Cryptosporangium sp. NPDC048952]|uniref:hypothetical protein n=1 Tax=Cryptosporangium sp. NPDC048952 TaxID=3363961 RepID=UPI00371218C9